MAPTITKKENLFRFIRKENPQWTPCWTDFKAFNPACIPDNIARAFVFEKQTFTPDQWGGKDMYGIDWVFVPTVGGSMEDPNVPHLLEEVEEWPEKVVFPDVDSWDWEEAAKRNEGVIDPDVYTYSWIFTGFFERLIAFMGFEGAAMALIDDEVEDELHELLDKIADTHIKVIGNLKKYFNIDGVYLHDDWGSQRAPFFSLNAARNMLVPHMKRVVDFCHENGMLFEFHSCGMIEDLVPAMIEMGVDMWCGQPMNDKLKLREMYGDKIAIGKSYENIAENEAILEELDKVFEAIKTDTIEKRMYIQDIPPVRPEITAVIKEKTEAIYAAL